MHSLTLASAIARLQNAQRAGRATITVPAPSHVLRSVFDVLLREGYLDSVASSTISASRVVSSQNKRPLTQVVPFTQTTGRALTLRLRYGPNGAPAFHTRFLASTSGRRVFLPASAF
jgi:ribosomal protein S8